MAGGGVYVRVRAYRREEKRVGGGGMEKAEKRFIPRAHGCREAMGLRSHDEEEDDDEDDDDDRAPAA